MKHLEGVQLECRVISCAGVRLSLGVGFGLGVGCGVRLKALKGRVRFSCIYLISGQCRIKKSLNMCLHMSGRLLHLSHCLFSDI